MRKTLPFYHKCEFRIVFCNRLTMIEKNPLTPDVILYPLLFVVLLWIVFWMESRFSVNFNQFGIFPLKISGLVGVITGPFIHGSLKHLFNNSVPLFVLSTALFYFYRNIRWRVLIYGLFLTGLLTWFIGRPSLHIGASGVVYMLVAFLFFKGVFSKQYHLTALALVVVFLYGGLWWYVFPIDPAISWEGHLSGFVIGLLFAFLFKTVPVQNKRYEWEKEGYDPDSDPFLRQFDDAGNFVGIPVVKESLTIDSTEKDPKTKVVYTFKENLDNPKV